MSNCEIFGTTNDAIGEAAVELKKKKKKKRKKRERKVICPFVV